ncbi:hypothetical protein MGG_15666 [Pyricularia oryzae 70-15]|uniref:Uncharacterized protein n=1 Tax=Pyricularia oryzae (strain 70-15 / ATCC MYA-4617 / FGSC 8958) TaxID=242507 RepID=G4MYJ8_PYRO7|nr:uncharacterized protein MGG_15666 [Pyricularia oryzae 70-15]EHA54423.1 hypothetical protein MGG_15666 [Pyricularia oryzae 70-15]
MGGMRYSIYLPSRYLTYLAINEPLMPASIFAGLLAHVSIFGVLTYIYDYVALQQNSRLAVLASMNEYFEGKDLMYAPAMLRAWGKYGTCEYHVSPVQELDSLVRTR